MNFRPTPETLPVVEYLRSTIGECPYVFRLTREVVDLPGVGPVDYWNMDGAHLRTRGGGFNGRSVVESWWATMFEGAREPREDDLRHYLLAQAHLRFAHAHSHNDLFQAAHLGPHADRVYSLGDAEYNRLFEGVAAGGPDFFEKEFGRLFLNPAALPRGRDAVGYDAAFGDWVGHGCAMVRAYGREGLEQALAKLEKVVRNFQQRGGAKAMKRTGDRVPRFVKAFRAECLARFHVCLANAWVFIRPWLIANRGLSTRSQRFMNLMHGIHTPAGGGPGGLCGYSLGLHPAGRLLLQKPEYLAPVGRWIDHPQYESHCLEGTAGGVPEYRHCLAAILCAAAEYDRCRRAYDGEGRASRAGKRRGLEGLDAESVRTVNRARPEEDVSGRLEAEVAQVFVGLAAERGIRCPKCSTPPRVSVHVAAPGVRASRVGVTYACDACDWRTETTFDQDAVEACVRARDSTAAA